LITRRIIIILLTLLALGAEVASYGADFPGSSRDQKHSAPDTQADQEITAATAQTGHGERWTPCLFPNFLLGPGVLTRKHAIESGLSRRPAGVDPRASIWQPPGRWRRLLCRDLT
jgi:hypothetical protein